MDVGFYLGELLMQRGEVKVPGLGNFLQLRMSAYYDENEALFHPPYNKVHFEPEADVDDVELAGYLVSKKGISLASAKYFIEKYIANLRQQAIVADVPLGNMGTFYTERAQLSFKPNDRFIDDQEFYGFTPVKIIKANAISVDQGTLRSPEPLHPRPNPEPEITAEIEDENIQPVAEENIEEPISSTYNEGFLDVPEGEEVEESRGPLRAILISLVVVAVLAVGFFVLYRYQPDTFNKLQFWKNSEPVAPVEAAPEVVTPETDSLYTDSAETALKDSVADSTIIVVPKRFELITGKGFKNLWAANEAVKKYKAMGLADAKLAEGTPGKLIKVSLGSFGTISESEALKQKLIKEGKLNKWAYTIELPNE